MSYILHPLAKTTPKIREEISKSTESLVVLAKKYNLNPKTIAKWKTRSSFEDRRSGPVKPRSVLSDKEQSIICKFRRITQFPLDDVFIALKDKIPALSRSNLYRCLKRGGLHKLPSEERKKRVTKQFKDYPLGFVHIDIAEVYTFEGKSYLFVGVERKSRYVYAELYDKMTIENSCAFLKNLIADSPCKIIKILTDNGAQFTYRLLAKHLTPKNKVHPFDDICLDEGIEHRLTQFKHPWTNGLVERMNRTIKDATVKTYFYEKLDELKQHLMLWLLMYNHQKKLKSLNYKSPYDKLIEEFGNEPKLFNLDPRHKLQGLNNATIP